MLQLSFQPPLFEPAVRPASKTAAPDQCIEFTGVQQLVILCRGLSDDAAYVHICGNETMSGMTFHTEPEVGPNQVLVADMTSNLLSRPVNVSKYGVIYASAGKNLGPAGNCVVIVRDDLIGNELPQVPNHFNSILHAYLVVYSILHVFLLTCHVYVPQLC